MESIIQMALYLCGTYIELQGPHCTQSWPSRLQLIDDPPGSILISAKPLPIYLVNPTQ